MFSIRAIRFAATDTDLFNGTLATLGKGGLSPLPVPALVTFQYNAQVPTSLQWNVGVQKSLPWEMVADVSYVGNHGYNRFGALQGGDTQNWNQVPLGTSYLPQYQDPTLGAPAYPGASAYSTNLLRPYVGLGTIGQNTSTFHDTYHSLQVAVNRRFSHGLSFGASYTLHFDWQPGNTGLLLHYVYGASGTTPTLSRRSGAFTEALNNNLDRRPHFLKFNSTWEAPGVTRAGALVHQLTKDWQLSGILTAASGTAYTLAYGYNTAGSNVNITGSPDFAGAVVLGSGVGSGCSGNPFSMINGSAVSGPTYGSTGTESPRLNMRACPTENVDTSVVRWFRFCEVPVNSRRFEFRADIFNTLNAVQFNSGADISTTATFNSPTGMALQNAEFNSSGAINAGKQLPKNVQASAPN